MNLLCRLSDSCDRAVVKWRPREASRPWNRFPEVGGVFQPTRRPMPSDRRASSSSECKNTDNTLAINRVSTQSERGSWLDSVRFDSSISFRDDTPIQTRPRFLLMTDRVTDSRSTGGRWFVKPRPENERNRSISPRCVDSRRSQNVAHVCNAGSRQATRRSSPPVGPVYFRGSFFHFGVQEIYGSRSGVPVTMRATLRRIEKHHERLHTEQPTNLAGHSPEIRGGFPV